MGDVRLGSSAAPANAARTLSVVVLGASGDLAKKKTFPSLMDLFADNLLPATVRIYGYARSAKTQTEFHALLRPYLEGRKFEESVLQAFLERCEYFQGNYGSGEDMARLNTHVAQAEDQTGLPSDRIFYFAIPPYVFVDSAAAIKASAAARDGYTRLIVEKPFGRDLESSNALSQALSSLWDEHHLYRIDHYLGKEMVQNLLVLRFANTFLEPVWNRQHVAAVQISFKEDFGTEGRGGYFDNYGIIRDVHQNHLLQVLSLVAMEAPTHIRSPQSGNAIRDAKVNVLRCIEPIKLEDVVLGQYVGNDAGAASYTEDDGVPKDSRTETYCACVIRINNQRWHGVPFILTAGKALEERKAQIRVQFKPVPGASYMFDGHDVPHNELVMEIQPNLEIKFLTNLKKPGLQATPVRSELDLTYKQSFAELANPEAYTRLILEVLRGNQAAFVRTDELQEAWRIFTPLLHTLEQSKITPLPYTYGSSGPREADVLMAANGFVLPDGFRYQQRAVRHIGPHVSDLYSSDT